MRRGTWLRALRIWGQDYEGDVSEAVWDVGGGRNMLTPCSDRTMGRRIRGGHRSHSQLRPPYSCWPQRLGRDPLASREWALT